MTDQTCEAINIQELSDLDLEAVAGGGAKSPINGGYSGIGGFGPYGLGGGGLGFYGGGHHHHHHHHHSGHHHH